VFASKVAFFAAATVTLAAILGSSASNAQPPAPPLTPLALEGDAARGEVLAETCNGCHGVAGSHNAYPSYHVPKLGGQNADYIEVALQGYRRGTRGHETMQAQASSLSDQDVADVAAFFAGLEGEPELGRTSGTALQVEEGRRKAVTCVQCHGQEGIAAAAQWPNLAGQHQSYLLESLLQYKNGTRADMLMGPLMAPLDEAAIEELAAFFAAQPHLHNTAR
jgi:cytochrome c553